MLQNKRMALTYRFINDHQNIHNSMLQLNDHLESETSLLLSSNA